MSEKKDIKIGTKEEVVWTKFKDACKARIESFEDALIVEREMLKVAKNKILLEQRK